MKKTKTRTGYKASKNGVCNDMKYEVGRTYTKRKPPIICEYGYHYCKKIDDVFAYYTYQKGITKLFEIEDLGRNKTDEDKTVTNKIKIVREIPLSEWNGLMKRHVFDDRGNMIKRAGETCEYETWNYDEKDRIIGHTTSWGYTMKWEYDDADRIIRKERETGFWETWEYNDSGDRTKMTNSDGFWEITEYDTCRNIIRKENSNKFVENWEYDADERIIAYNNSDRYGYTCSYDADGNEEEFKEIKC